LLNLAADLKLKQYGVRKLVSRDPDYAEPTPLFDTYLIEFATAREEKRKKMIQISQPLNYVNTMTTSNHLPDGIKSAAAADSLQAALDTATSTKTKHGRPRVILLGFLDSLNIFSLHRLGSVSFRLSHRLLLSVHIFEF
jgi:hypothetical protein